MAELWIRVKWTNNGRSVDVRPMKREEAMGKLVEPVKRRGQGRFKIYPEDLGITLKIKQAVAAAGGTKALSILLGVERTNFYQWLKREMVPKNYREQIRELAIRYEMMEQSEGEWEGEDEGT
jgi:hypothetical protein